MINQRETRIRYDPNDSADAFSVERRIAEQMAIEMMRKMRLYYPYRVDPVDWTVKVREGISHAVLEMYFDPTDIPPIHFGTAFVHTNEIDWYGGFKELETRVVSMEYKKVDGVKLLRIKIAYPVAKMSEDNKDWVYLRDPPCYRNPI